MYLGIVAGWKPSLNFHLSLVAREPGLAAGHGIELSLQQPNCGIGVFVNPGSRGKHRPTHGLPLRWWTGYHRWTKGSKD